MNLSSTRKVIGIINILSYSVVFIKENKSITPLPLTFSWEIYEFFRSSHRRRFMEKAALKNFAIVTGKMQT